MDVHIQEKPDFIGDVMKRLSDSYPNLRIWVTKTGLVYEFRATKKEVSSNSLAKFINWIKSLAIIPNPFLTIDYSEAFVWKGLLLESFTYEPYKVYIKIYGTTILEFVKQIGSEIETLRPGLRVDITVNK